MSAIAIRRLHEPMPSIDVFVLGMVLVLWTTLAAFALWNRLRVRLGTARTTPR